MRCIMHGQTAAAAPQIVEYAKESFADQETWEACGAPKNDTLISTYYSYRTGTYISVYAYHAGTQTVSKLFSTSTYVAISVQSGKIIATQNANNSAERGRVVLTV